jgi:hypothetical protein
LPTEVDVEEPDVEAPAGSRGEREERDDWDGDGVLRRIDESLLRACMVAEWRMMKSREIDGKYIIKVTYELDEGHYIPFDSFVLDS